MPTLELVLNSKTGKYEVASPTPPGLSASGVLGAPADALAKFEVMGVPVGQAVLGLAIAGVGDLLIRWVGDKLPLGDKVTPKQRRALLLFAAAWGLQLGPVKKAIGGTAATVGSTLLTADAINNVVDIRGMVASLGAPKTVATRPAGAAAPTSSHQSHNSHNPAMGRAELAGV